ncbi:hypothetical protein [Gloeobacter violaceus]|uniref:Gsl2426 protein n=1 Tax=Gloeobacter violaceus (strain ATCC 29082 / PCC 7421) TaxID=251221 RepID=Q7NHV9_GLOVI|nr:hypothetical protein [Gloeobacter violaceus]BAC90367.1 gsl2426 [Gloeobacter violaceus PCC 7421]
MSEERLKPLETGLERLSGITERFIDVSTQRFERYDQILQRLADTTTNVGQAVEELRAANRRQEAINDYLVRRDQERGNGNRN